MAKLWLPEGGQCFLVVVVGGRDSRHHEGLRVSSQATASKPNNREKAKAMDFERWKSQQRDDVSRFNSNQAKYGGV